MFAEHHSGRNDAAESILVAMVAEVLLVCATALGFFVQLDLPVSLATGGALAVLFVGSVLCWKSQMAAGAILAISLLFVQVMLITRFPVLLVPFALVDIILVVVVAGGYHAGEQSH